ncbi:preprotein translocase subunit SecG [Opitutaceae bacterium TAV4]|uniref:preprotein translocase subunit SecG n=1 Tax=Geminisphaera colitermitum TaxID=1148786 RepID=UPI0001965599|nr:preprotein translocase subunit SecG [Geminisphaera colitermitum]RRJ98198.1 preprotein translocase subunit SecG [Opitutaceae bacterium TAV4]RRK00548.1 preprotein translocase subunit SecG [Opitutaceae bacterium TAV3]
MSIVIWLLTFVLILVCVFLILVVLMQKPKSDGGMGAALGGGMTEATFGADTGNVLTKATIRAAIIFFILSFGLYLGHIWQSKTVRNRGALPTIPAAEAPAEPATSATPATVPDASATTITAEPAKSDAPAAAAAGAEPEAKR